MNFKGKKANSVYLDYAAGAPETAVSRHARKYADRFYGNPSSIHADGRASRVLLDSARADCAGAFSAHSDEIIFTGSGTESVNMAIFGIFKHIKLSDPQKPVHIITSVIEHQAVLSACQHLETVGATVTYVPVGIDGLINPNDVRNALTENTVLVSIGYANSEIGVVQPIREIAKEIRHFRKNRNSGYPYFHIDAAQASMYLDIQVDRLGVDLLSCNGTKLGGPRGTGLLYVKRGVEIAPLVYGGGQEKGIRSGTENVSAVYGFAHALLHARKHASHEHIRLQHLRDYFFAELTKVFPHARINGSMTERLPNNVNASFKNFDSELLVIELDAKGISVSAGSACDSAHDKASHVISALYGTEEQKWGTVRFSMGYKTKKRDITRALNALKAIFKKYEQSNVVLP